MKTKAIKVFISYAHDSPEYMDKVLSFANKLRSDGIDCILDQYEQFPAEGWPRWMNHQIREADFVLMICTKKYYSQVSKGVNWEINLIFQHLYDANTINQKFIPVLFENSKNKYIPEPFRGVNYYQIDKDEDYEKLYCILSNQPHIKKPELGVIRKLTSLSARGRKTLFYKPWYVPYSPDTFFTGRENILKTLKSQLNLTKSVVISQAIHGFGGIGKTQIAIEYAYCYRSEYEAVFWVTSASRDTIVSDFVKISSVLNLPEQNAKEQQLAVAAVKRWLQQNSDWLLIFDNADEPVLIKDFIPLEIKGRILLTSRASTFDELGISTPIKLKKMKSFEAVKFLRKRTGRKSINKKEMESLNQLIYELDYLPLALAFAGAYILHNQCTFQDYLYTFQKIGIQLLEKGRISSTKYSKSVATTWLMNFEKIEKYSNASIDILNISAFLHSERIPLEFFSLGAKELGHLLSKELSTIESNPLIIDELLEPLYRYSLIYRDVESKTYDIHRLVQMVLMDRLDNKTQCKWAERIIRAFHLVFPSPEFENWAQCERLILHARLCLKLIKSWSFNFTEAASLLLTIGLYLKYRGYYSECENYYKEALEIRKKSFGISHPDVAECLNNLALLYYTEGKYSEAVPIYKEALEIYKKEFDEDHPDVAQCINNLALLFEAQAKYLEAELLYKKSLEILEKKLGKDHRYVADNLNNLAMLYEAQGKYLQAESLHIKAMEMRKKLLGEDHPDYASSLNNLAELYRTQQKYSKAEPLYKKALAIDMKALGDTHPDVAIDLHNMAILYINQGKYSQAETYLKKSLKIQIESFGETNPYVATGYHHMAIIYRSQGKYSESELLCNKALELRKNSLGEDHPYFATSLHNLAELYIEQGKYNEAEPLLKRSLKILEKTFDDEHHYIIKCLDSLIKVYNKIGKKREAETYLKRKKMKSHEK